jgi:hypothetical protein
MPASLRSALLVEEEAGGVLEEKRNDSVSIVVVERGF